GHDQSGGACRGRRVAAGARPRRADAGRALRSLPVAHSDRGGVPPLQGRRAWRRGHGDARRSPRAAARTAQAQSCRSLPRRNDIMKTLPLLLPLCLLLAACKPPGDGPAPADAPQVQADAPAVPAETAPAAEAVEGKPEVP